MGTEKCSNIISRLNRIEGQVRGVKRMIENGEDCGEILNQIAAIKSAVQNVGIIVFETHARECIYQACLQNNPEENFNDVIKMMGRIIK